MDLPKALTILQQRNPYSSILCSNGGIVFLATPHRGSTNAPLAEIGTRICQVARLGAPSTSSAGELEMFSSTVEDIHSDFTYISNKFKIISFFEQRGYPGIGVVSDLKPRQFRVAKFLLRLLRVSLLKWISSRKFILLP